MNDEVKTNDEIRQELIAYSKEIDDMRDDLGALLNLIEINGDTVDEDKIVDGMVALYGTRKAADDIYYGKSVYDWLLLNSPETASSLGALYIVFTQISCYVGKGQEVHAMYQALKDMDMCLCGVSANVFHVIRNLAA